MLCFRSLLIQLCVTLNKRRPCLLSTSNELVTDSPAPLRFSCLGFLILLMRFIKQRNKTNFEKKKHIGNGINNKEEREMGTGAVALHLDRVVPPPPLLCDVAGFWPNWERERLPAADEWMFNHGSEISAHRWWSRITNSRHQSWLFTDVSNSLYNPSIQINISKMKFKKTNSVSNARNWNWMRWFTHLKKN